MKNYAVQLDRVMRFVDALIDRMGQQDVRVELVPEAKLIEHDSEPTGTYHEDARLIRVAAAQPLDRWVTTLVHESCHAQQAVEKTAAYEIFQINRPTEVINTHLAGESIPTTQLRRAVLELIDYEREAEEMTIQTLRANRLGGSIIDIDRYGRLANVYLCWHHVLPQVGWYGYPSVQQTEPFLHRFSSRIESESYYHRNRRGRTLMKCIESAGIIESTCSTRLKSSKT